MPHVPLFVGDDRYDPDPHEAYRLTIEHIDHSVGRIMQTLEDLGVADNTLLIYTSDNGPWLSKKHHGGSALPLRAGKATTYEGGMRVPCVMRWPAGIVENQTCREVAATIDILPTIAKIVGVKRPSDRPIDGREITELFQNPDAKSPHATEGFYYYRKMQVEAVRIGHYKLHFKKPVQLYDLSKDISEEQNLAASLPQVVTSMTRQAETYHQKLISEKRPIWRESVK
jgi:arylsulfatase A-like enzyme